MWPACETADVPCSQHPHSRHATHLVLRTGSLLCTRGRGTRPTRRFLPPWFVPGHASNTATACGDDEASSAWLGAFFSCSYLGKIGWCAKGANWEPQTSNRCPATCGKCSTGTLIEAPSVVRAERLLVRHPRCPAALPNGFEMWHRARSLKLNLHTVGVRANSCLSG